jgi:hypothetical protein
LLKINFCRKGAKDAKMTVNFWFPLRSLRLCGRFF